MKITKLNCATCGAPISLPDDLDFINCASCGSYLGIERGEGYVALKVAEKITGAITDSGRDTQDVIRENTRITRNELQRLQIAHELSAAHLLLANIQAEIRGLERGYLDVTTSAQLVNLHISEYQAMDRIRFLETSLPAPDPLNLVACIQFIEREITWINAELYALKLSNLPQFYQVKQGLISRKNFLARDLHNLKVRELKTHFMSFRVINLPVNDQTQAAEFIGILAIDEKALDTMRGSSEVEVVYSELWHRKLEVTQAWTRMEQERLSGMLSTSAYRVDRENQASLYEYLGRIEQDLANLGNGMWNGNEVAQEFQRWLIDEKNRTWVQIRVLEKRAHDLRNVSVLVAILVSITAVFVGLAALVKEGIGFISSQLRGIPNKQAPSDESDETITPGQRQSDRKEPAIPIISTAGSGKKIDLKPIGIGVLIWLLLVAGFLIIGVITWIALTPKGAIATGWEFSVLLLFPAIGFGWGALIFMRRVAPGTKIRGFVGKPDLSLTPMKDVKGIGNPIFVKTLVGTITWVLVYWIMLTLAGLITSGGQASYASIAVVTIGLILGPVLAWVVFTRTFLSQPDNVNDF